MRRPTNSDKETLECRVRWLCAARRIYFDFVEKLEAFFFSVNWTGERKKKVNWVEENKIAFRYEVFKCIPCTQRVTYQTRDRNCMVATTINFELWSCIIVVIKHEGIEVLSVCLSWVSLPFKISWRIRYRAHYCGVIWNYTYDNLGRMKIQHAVYIPMKKNHTYTFGISFWEKNRLI